MKRLILLIPLILWNSSIQSQIVSKHPTDTTKVCLSKDDARYFFNLANDAIILKIEREASIKDLNLKDKKIAKRNTAIEILSGVVLVLSTVIVIK